MSPFWLAVVGAAIIAAFIWLSHFIHAMRTPIDRLDEVGREEAQRIGFGVGFVVALIVVSCIASMFPQP